MYLYINLFPEEMNIKWDLSVAIGATPLAAFVKLPSSTKKSSISDASGGGGAETGVGTSSKTDGGGSEIKNNSFAPSGRGAFCDRGEFSSPVKSDVCCTTLMYKLLSLFWFS